MAWKASKWGLSWPFADKGHELATIGVALYVGRKGRERRSVVSLAVRCHLFAACCRRNAISLFALLAVCCRCLLSAAVQVAPLEVAVGAQIAVCAYGSARYGEDSCIASVFFFQGVA